MDFTGADKDVLVTPAHILRLQNDWLVAVYSRRISPWENARASAGMAAGPGTRIGKSFLSNAVPQDAGDMGYLPAAPNCPTARSGLFTTRSKNRQMGIILA